jgi:hypothetical protein
MQVTPGTRPRYARRHYDRESIVMRALLRLVPASFLLASTLAGAQSAPEPEFRPSTLAGEWKLEEFQTGIRHSGEVRIELQRREGHVIQGLVSFDGRQTQYKCGTRGFASDTPVPAEIVKDATGYSVSFELRCTVGAPSRRFLWYLTCRPDGECRETAGFPWGPAVVTVREKK